MKWEINLIIVSVFHCSNKPESWMIDATEELFTCRLCHRCDDKCRSC